MDLELRGRTAVVTGCSVGIGREIARVLAAEGVSALVVARRGELLKTLQDEIEGAGWPRPHALAIDLTSGREAVLGSAGAKPSPRYACRASKGHIAWSRSTVLDQLAEASSP